MNVFRVVQAHDPDIWGPTFFYANGQYYGQTLCSDGQGATRGRDCEVPHGNGTYVSSEGREIYSGEWWQGERVRGIAMGKNTGKSADLVSQTDQCQNQTCAKLGIDS